MEMFKKIAKAVAIIVAVAGAIAGIYVVVKKLCAKKNAECEDSQENYVSCSCCDAEFISEQKK